VGVAVLGARGTVGSPTGVGHRGLRKEHLGHVNGARADLGSTVGGGDGGSGDSAGNELAESGDLANLLEENVGAVGRVTIDTDTFEGSVGNHRGTMLKSCVQLTSRVVSTVLHAGEGIAENVADVLAVPLGQVGAVGKDSCRGKRRLRERYCPGGLRTDDHSPHILLSVRGTGR
jgi:hypothetical protein